MIGSGRTSRAAGAALVAACAAAWLACGVQPVPPAFQDDAVEESEFRIAPSDVLTVRVWKSPELSVEAPVLPDGTLTVPLAGSVSAAGLTTGELEDVIAGRLADYITTPEVAVIVHEVNSKRISVIGEVGRSGPQNVAIDARVVDALSAAGGFTTYANRKKVKIIRRTPEGDAEFRFNFDAYQAGDAAGTNVRLKPGDIVVVPD